MEEILGLALLISSPTSNHTRALPQSKLLLPDASAVLWGCDSIMASAPWSR